MSRKTGQRILQYIQWTDRLRCRERRLKVNKDARCWNILLQSAFNKIFANLLFLIIILEMLLLEKLVLKKKRTKTNTENLKMHVLSIRRRTQPKLIRQSWVIMLWNGQKEIHELFMLIVNCYISFVEYLYCLRDHFASLQTVVGRRPEGTLRRTEPYEVAERCAGMRDRQTNTLSMAWPQIINNNQPQDWPRKGGIWQQSRTKIFLSKLGFLQSPEPGPSEVACSSRDRPRRWCKLSPRCVQDIKNDLHLIALDDPRE